MSVLSPKCDTSELAAVGVASVAFVLVLDNSYYYELISTTACWFKQSDDAAAAAAAAGSWYLPANTPKQIHGARGTRVTVIQAAAGGTAMLGRLERQ